MLRRAFLLPACVAVVFVAGTAATQSVSPALKSHHLLNLPASISEADVVAAFRDVNSAITEAGYPGAGYRLWKISGEQVGEYGYLWEGNWPNQEAYRSIHDDPGYVAAMGRHESVVSALAESQVYNRYVEIPTGN